MSFTCQVFAAYLRLKLTLNSLCLKRSKHSSVSFGIEIVSGSTMQNLMPKDNELHLLQSYCCHRCRLRQKLLRNLIPVRSTRHMIQYSFQPNQCHMTTFPVLKLVLSMCIQEPRKIRRIRIEMWLLGPEFTN